jgi:RHS repeat-associated protein
MDRTSGEYYYIYDGLGSARQLVNASGTVTDTYSYDAFGDLTSSPQPTPNPFLFNGQDMDGATGLIYLRARYMNPEDGRFLSQDSYEGSGEDPISLHRYLYAGDDPVIMDDPSGNAKVEVRFYFAGDPSPDKNYYAGRNSHGFVEITDIDKKKTKWYARGGPISSQYPLIFPIEAQVGLYSPRTYDWSTRPLPDVVLTNDSLPAKYYIDKLAVEAFKINSAKIKYSLLRNSNTVCHDLVRTLGFKMQPPPGVIAPGWNTNLWGGWVVQNILGPASPIGIAATAEVMALGDFDEGDE